MLLVQLTFDRERGWATLAREAIFSVAVRGGQEGEKQATAEGIIDFINGG